MRKYLRAANVTWNGLSLHDVKEMNFEPAEFERYRLESGDLLLSEGSGTPEEVGKPAIWGGELPECAFQNTLVRVRPVGAIDRTYLLYLFWYEAKSGNFGAASRGVNIHHIGVRSLSEWPIPVPPVHEQHRIVGALEEQLSRLESSEESLRRAKLRLRALRSSALKATYEGAGPLRLLGDVCAKPQYGWTTRSVARAGTVRLLRITDIQEGEVDWDSVPHCEQEPDDVSRFLLQPGDLVVARSGATVGKTFLLQGSPPSVFASYLIRLRSMDSLLPEFLAWFCQTPDYWNQISRASAGMAQPNVNGKKLAAIQLPVPPIKLQEEAVAGLRHTTSILDAMDEGVGRALRRAEEVRRAVLRAAFSGRLLRDDPTSEAGRESAGMLFGSSA